jgi:hypothetical protein
MTAARDTLAYASTPVAVTMTSDWTHRHHPVARQAAGHAGRANAVAATGVYTAVGIRNGYRDVRIKFEVRPDQANAVEVRCVETI